MTFLRHQNIHCFNGQVYFYCTSENIKGTKGYAVAPHCPYSALWLSPMTAKSMPRVMPEVMVEVQAQSLKNLSAEYINSLYRANTFNSIQAVLQLTCV